MNHDTYTRLAEQRLEQTARQARTAWWRSQAPARESDPAPVSLPRLHWIAPVTTRTAGV
jgi:hypothetical protein